MTPGHTPSRRREGTRVVRVFNELAERYDRWFDAPDGRSIFQTEVACLRKLIGEADGRWMEIGVGTGRFAEALGIPEGIDPSGAVLAFAARRGIRTRLGYGENLPYRDAVFDGVLMVVTICFLADPPGVFAECARVLRAGGRLVVGLVPADSPWGRHYARLGCEGHPFYSAAKFHTCERVVELADEARFALERTRSCLFPLPGETVTDKSSRDGVVPGAGFAAMRFVRLRD